MEGTIWADPFQYLPSFPLHYHHHPPLFPQHQSSGKTSHHRLFRVRRKSKAGSHSAMRNWMVTLLPLKLGRWHSGVALRKGQKVASQPRLNISVGKSTQWKSELENVLSMRPDRQQLKSMKYTEVTLRLTAEAGLQQQAGAATNKQRSWRI